MKISWINDVGIRAETSQGLILFNHDESTLNESSQKDENTIAIFLDENLKKDAEKKLLETTVSIFEPGEYEVNNINTGMAHYPLFSATVTLWDGRTFNTADNNISSLTNKKKAEHEAARLALFDIYREIDTGNQNGNNNIF